MNDYDDPYVEAIGWAILAALTAIAVVVFRRFRRHR